VGGSNPGRDRNPVTDRAKAADRSATMAHPWDDRGGNGMRLLIYAQASSGSSVLCHFLAQRPASVAVIDVWSQTLTPSLDLAVPVVAKATVTTKYSVKDHIASFRPDRTIVMIRDPVAVYLSLREHSYADDFGTLDEKIARFDEEFASGNFDLTVRYEDFVVKHHRFLDGVNRLGWPVTEKYYDLVRSLNEIRNFGFSCSLWLKEKFRRGWGYGNITPGGIAPRFNPKIYPAEVLEKVATLSPCLNSLYENTRPIADTVRTASDKSNCRHAQIG
jgi:hypothetical protein